MPLVVLVLVLNGIIFQYSCFYYLWCLGLSGVHFLSFNCRAFEMLSLLMLVMGIWVTISMLVLLFLCVDFVDMGRVTS